MSQIKLIRRKEINAVLPSNDPLDCNRLIHVAGLFSAVLYIVIGKLNRSAAGIDLWPFLILMVVLALVTAGLYKILTHHRDRASQHHGSSSATSPDISVIVLWAVLFRIIGVYYDPIMEDDYYRYLWDGYVFLREGTPYGIAPSDFFGNSSVSVEFKSILDRINYPDTATIYGPLLQYCFALSYLLFPGQVFGLQLLFSAADIVLILVLARMSSRPALLLFSWCPLLIKETAFTAHPDTLGVLLLMGSILALQRQRLTVATVLLALSLCTKVFALLLVPLILCRCRPRHWLLFSITVAVVYAPFWWHSTSDASGLSAFASDWQFNGSFHALFTWWSTQWGYSQWLPKAIMALVFCGLYALYAWHYLMKGLSSGEYDVPRGDWVYGVFFLLAPVVNAWYLVWLLAFATVYPSRWAWVASAVILLSYVTGGSFDADGLDLYQQPQWARLLEYGIILSAFLLDLKNRKDQSAELTNKYPQKFNRNKVN